MIGETNHVPGAAEHELEIARRIQQSFLPDALPQAAGWELSAWFKAAREVAGDFYDAFPLANGRRIGLVIADVCDKGVGAALFMALFRTLIRAFADQHYALGWMGALSDRPLDPPPASTLQQRRSRLSTGTTSLKNAVTLTNRYVTRNHGNANMFATMFIGIVDPETGSLIYINAGHEPALVLSAGGVRARLPATSPAVGLMPDLEFHVEQFDLLPGDTLFTYTDGVLDARDAKMDGFGEERMIAALAGAVDAEDMLGRLRAALHAFAGPEAQYDDITMLAMRFGARA